MKISTAVLIFFIGVMAILIARYVMVKYDFFTGSPVTCGFKTLGSYKLTTDSSAIRATGAKGLIYISDLTKWSSISRTKANDSTYSYTDFTAIDLSDVNVKTRINNVMGCNNIPEFSGQVGVNSKTALILCLQSTTTPDSRVFFVKCFVPSSTASDSNVIVGEIEGNTIATYSGSAKPVAVIQGASGTPNTTDTYTLSYTLCVAASRPEGFSYTDCCSNLISDSVISLVSATYYPSDVSFNPTGAENATYKDNMKTKIATYFTSTSKTVTIPFTWNAFLPSLGTSGDPAVGKIKKLNIKYRCGSSSTVLSYTSGVNTTENSAGSTVPSPTETIVLSCSKITSTDMTTDDLKTPTQCSADRAAADTTTGTNPNTFDWGGTDQRDPNCKAGKHSVVTGGYCTGTVDTDLYKRRSADNDITTRSEALAYLAARGRSDESDTSWRDLSKSDIDKLLSLLTGSDSSSSSLSDSDIAKLKSLLTTSNSSSSRLSDSDIAKLKNLLSNNNSPNDFSFPQKYYNNRGGSGSLKPGLSDCQKYYNCKKNDDEDDDYEGQCL